MDRYIKGIFGKLYKFYKKWGDEDAFFSTCFVFSVLITSTINFLNALIFYATRLEALRFSLVPIGVILIGIITILTINLKYRKEELLKDDLKYSNREHTGMRLMILFMFSTWILAPVFYKLAI